MAFLRYAHMNKSPEFDLIQQYLNYDFVNSQHLPPFYLIKHDTRQNPPVYKIFYSVC